MTPEQTKRLWRALRGVTEFEHDLGYSYGSEQPICRRCSDLYKENCDPIEFPGTEADIAEEIRVWMEKQPDTLQAEWIRSLYDIPWKQANSIQLGVAVGVILVFILKTTPADKIKAFLSLKENQDE